MTIAHPFNRQVEVIVGPLPEYLGGGSEKDGIRLFGNGSTDNLRIKFDINKPASGSVVSVYNLGPKIRQALHREKALSMIVRAGWLNFGMIEIWKGALMASFSYRQGADIVTDLIGYAAWTATMETVSIVAMASGSKIKNEIIKLAQQMPGVTVDPLLIDVDDVTLGTAGLDYANTISQILDSLSRTYGFQWWVDMGVFYAVQNSRYFTTEAIPTISGKTGYLIRAEPMISSPIPFKIGLSVSSLFYPYIKPYTLVNIESVINPELNGEYVVRRLSHNGDTHSNQWNTELQSWIVDDSNIGGSPIRNLEFTDIELIAGTIYGEAAGESTDGKIAVGMTIQTRVENPRWWGRSWREVTLKKNQFKCWDDNLAMITNARNSNNSTWRECVSIATKIHSGQKFNIGLTKSPTHFFRGAAPSWSKSGMDFIGDVGNHHFYHDRSI